LKKLIGLTLFLGALVVVGCGGGGGGGDVTGGGNGGNGGGNGGGTTGIVTGVRGVVRNPNGPIQGAIVRFFSPENTEITAVTTNAQGNYAAELPTTASRFTVDLANVDPGGTTYFRQYSFSQKDYTANSIECSAPLPAITQNQVRQVSDVMFLYRWMGPPPPPTGCLR
jgi:hypothetical protein